MRFPHAAAGITIWLTVATGATTAWPAWAQPVPIPQPPPPPQPRFDAAGFVGWYNGHRPEIEYYDSWYNQSVYGGGSLGFYWTAHLKAEVEFGATTEDDLSSLETFTIGGRDQLVGVEHTFSAKNLSIGQHYQFFENAWFHPALGAGVAVTWERETVLGPSLFQFDPRAPARGIGQRVYDLSSDTKTHLDLFASTGFKAYLSRRAFFRSDLKVVFGDQVKDVLARIGFGFDF
jgi:hypothetical protein